MSDPKTVLEIQEHLKRITNDAAKFIEGLNAELAQAEKRLADANAAYEQSIKEWIIKLADALKSEKQADTENAANVKADMNNPPGTL